MSSPSLTSTFFNTPVKVDFNWNTTNGVTLRWLQGIGGKNTSNGSTFFFTYNHVFKPASK